MKNLKAFLKNSQTSLERLDKLYENKEYNTINLIGNYIFNRPTEALTLFYISKGINNSKELCDILDTTPEYMTDVLYNLKKYNLIKKVWITNLNSL